MSDRYARAAGDLLAALTTRLPALTGTPVPERRYTHVGEVAIDLGCDQLVVAFERAFPGLPGLEVADARPTPGMVTAQFGVGYTRCVPTLDRRGGNPTAAQLDAAGQQGMLDADAVVKATRDAHKAGEWAATCDVLLWAETVTLGPAGGAGGVLVRLLAQV